jgi:hypothetical protein
LSADVGRLTVGRGSGPKASLEKDTLRRERGVERAAALALALAAAL